jgi:Activator of Hsp90 ATPase homolog 1-like protein
MQDALVVRRETHISAPRAAVFALLTDPEKILRWMGTEAQLEAQPGGLYLVNVKVTLNGDLRYCRRIQVLMRGAMPCSSPALRSAATARWYPSRACSRSQ